jgi:glycolate oxidase iron-sulfur subunit
MVPSAPVAPTAAALHLHEHAHEAANRCIQCGYCLPVCPTYHSMGRETQSPRGRINLVKAAAEGKIDLLRDMAPALDLCLGCRACEVACPVGVPYGQILEAAKASAVEARQEAGGSALEGLLVRGLFSHPGRMRAAGNLTWLAQVTGLHRVANASGLVRRISPAFGAMSEILPAMDAPWRRLKNGTVLPATRERKARVAFFQGCVMDAVLHRTNRLSVELLRRIGCEVVIPAEQCCCGALHAHQGTHDEALSLAKRNIEAFEKTGADYFVNNAGGCGAMLRTYDAVFRGEPDWEERSRVFAGRSRDISEVLVELGPLPVVKQLESFVTYQDSCHLRNVQRVIEPPRRLLREVAGDRFVELTGASECCASGGIYNLLHFRESMKILDGKMEKVEEAAATIVVTTNPGCQLQMSVGLRRAGLSSRIRSLHLVEVLAECCGME